MKCPRCSNVTLLISEKQSVEIDYCPECRGIWLDRGELEKIIERSGLPQNAIRDDRYDSRRPKYDDDHHDKYDDDDDDDHRRGFIGGDRRPHKKRSFLGDLFDF